MKMCKIRDLSEIPDFQWNAPQKHQEIVTFIKGSGAGGGGSWVFAENMEILEIRWKWQKTAEILEFHKKARKQKTAEMGKLRIPRNRGPQPGPPCRPVVLVNRRIHAGALYKYDRVLQWNT